MALSPTNVVDLPVRNSLRPPAIRGLQIVWVLLQASALVVMILATPALYRAYNETCPESICALLAQPTEQTVETLGAMRTPLPAYAAIMVTLGWVSSLVWITVGGLVIWKRPRDIFGLLFAFCSVFFSSSVFMRALDQEQLSTLIVSRVGVLVALASAPLILALFPNGRWVPDWAKWVALGGVVHAIVFTLAPQPRGQVLEVLDSPLAILFWGCLVGTQVYRYRQVSTTIERQQTKWLLFGISLLAINQILVGLTFAFGAEERYQLLIVMLEYIASPLVVVAIAHAIFRHRLFEIDLIVNRTLLYGGMTVGVVGIYALIVGGLGAFLHEEGYTLSFLAAGLLAVLFQPMRDRLQRAINHLLYGVRDEPYTALGKLGEQLESTLAHSDVLPTLVETIATTLKLPYTGIMLGKGDELTTGAEYGSRPAMTERVDLVYQGETLGHLLIAARPGESRLSDGDRHILQHLARQAGVAAHGVQLMDDLQRSRIRLVNTREEERRRLRRDLHDGLGPQLASQMLTIEAALRLVDRDPDSAVELMHSLKEQSQDAIASIRRLVYDLRPPALDDLGLTGAIEAQADTFRHTSMEIHVDVPRPMPPLPAAIEVASYRIVQEALTNAVRHANARCCTISIAVTRDALHISINDNGVGLPDGHVSGVGMNSMRERAAELGGRLNISSPGPGAGTLVAARLPLPQEE